MNQEQKEQIQYDRLNTRYNRLWDQVSNTGIFILTVITAYVLALKSIEKRVDTILTFDQMNYILLVLAIVVASISMVLITYLILTRKQLNDLFDSYGISI